MRNADPHVSNTGTFEDLCAFFRVSARTGRRWVAEAPPVVSYWRNGRDLRFSEDAVVDLMRRGLVASRRMAPGETEAMARKAWREHLRMRSGSAAPATEETILQALLRRVEELEKKLGTAEHAEHAEGEAALRGLSALPAGDAI